MIKIDLGDVEILSKKLSEVAYKYPSEVNSFMQHEVNGFKDSIKQEEDPRWLNKITHSKYANPWIPFSKARYSKSSERDGIKSWWIINNKMFYERFVNDGHQIRRKKRGPSIGETKATHHIENGSKKYEPTMFSNFEKFVKELLGI